MHENEAYSEHNVENRKRFQSLQRRWIIVISICIAVTIFVVTFSLLLKFVIVKPGKSKTTATTSTIT